MTRKTLKARDIERLENTSFAMPVGGVEGGGANTATDTCPSDTCQCTECLGPTSCCRALQELIEDYVTNGAEIKTLAAREHQAEIE